MHERTKDERQKFWLRSLPLRKITKIFYAIPQHHYSNTKSANIGFGQSHVVRNEHNAFYENISDDTRVT